MNIFILDYDIQQSAKYHCDQHVNKMILEAAQMLCTVVGEQGYPVPYRPTHPNHPCTKWVRESIDNFVYLADLAFYLNEEAKSRYKRKTDHKSWLVIQSIATPVLPEKGLTPFARAMPEQFKKIPDTVEAYREYYKTKEFATWKGEKPAWL